MCLSIRSPERYYMNTHTFSTIFACFCERDTTKAATITDGWKRRLKKDVNRCISTIFIDAMSSIQFQTLMVWLTTYFFFFSKHILQSHLVTINGKSDSSFAFPLFYWIALCSIFMYMCNMIPMENMGSFQVNRMLNKLLFLSLSLYSSKLVILAHCVYKKGVLQIQKTFG